MPTDRPLGGTRKPAMSPARSRITLEGHRRLLLAVAFLVAIGGLIVAVGPFALTPRPLSPAIPGLTLEELGARRGVVVTSVEDAGMVDRADVRVGDRIVTLDARRIRSLDDAREVVATLHPRVLDMMVIRGPESVEIAYPLPPEDPS